MDDHYQALGLHGLSRAASEHLPHIAWLACGRRGGSSIVGTGSLSQNFHPLARHDVAFKQQVWDAVKVHGWERYDMYGTQIMNCNIEHVEH